MSDFNKELSGYLNKRNDDDYRFRELVDYAQMKAERGDKDGEEIVVIKEKSNFQFYLDKTVGKLREAKKPETEDEEDINDEELAEMAEKPEGFFTNLSNRMRDFFSPSDEVQEEMDEAAEEEDGLPEDVREDFRKLTEFTKDILTRLHKRDLELVKKDPRFSEFKEILQRRKIIK